MSTLLYCHCGAYFTDTYAYLQHEWQHKLDANQGSNLSQNVASIPNNMVFQPGGAIAAFNNPVSLGQQSVSVRPNNLQNIGGTPMTQGISSSPRNVVMHNSTGLQARGTLSAYENPILAASLQQKGPGESIRAPGNARSAPQTSLVNGPKSSKNKKSKQPARTNVPIVIAPETDHNCNLCTASFGTQNELDQHKSLVHKQNNLITCPTCSAVFPTREVLADHMKSHAPSMAICKECQEPFSNAEELTVHMREKHQDEEEAIKPFVCMHCKLRFAKRDQLLGHLSLDHPENGHQCNICKKAFPSRDALKTHMANIHSIKENQVKAANQTGVNVIPTTASPLPIVQGPTINSQVVENPLLFGLVSSPAGQASSINTAVSDKTMGQGTYSFSQTSKQNSTIQLGGNNPLYQTMQMAQPSPFSNSVPPSGPPAQTVIPTTPSSEVLTSTSLQGPMISRVFTHTYRPAVENNLGQRTTIVANTLPSNSAASGSTLTLSNQMFPDVRTSVSASASLKHLASAAKNSASHHQNVSINSNPLASTLSTSFSPTHKSTVSVQESIDRIFQTAEKATKKSTVDSFQCGICKAFFNSYTVFKCHTESHNRAGVILERDEPDIPIPKVTHTCHACHETFDSEESLSVHIEKTCPILESIDRSVQTAKKKSSGITYQCGICKAFFSSSGLLKLHIESHKRSGVVLERDEAEIPTPKVPVTCNVCQETFDSEESLSVHLEKHIQEAKAVETESSTNEKHKCYMCEKEFQTNVELKTHLESHNTVSEKVKKTAKTKKPNISETKTKKVVKPSVIPNSSPKPGPKSQKAVTKTPSTSNTTANPPSKPKSTFSSAPNVGKIYTCKVCRKNFTTEKDCANHIKKSHGEELSKGKLSALSKNTNSASGGGASQKNTAFPCTVCDRIWASKEALNKHMESHVISLDDDDDEDDNKDKNNEKDKPKTPRSNKGESLSSPKENTKSNVLKCNFCPKEFFYRTSLEMHITETHKLDPSQNHGENSFTCQACKKVFKRTAELIIHSKNCQKLRDNVSSTAKHTNPENQRANDRNEKGKHGTPSAIKQKKWRLCRDGPEIWRCKICRLEMASKTDLNRHLYIHKENVTVKNGHLECSSCSESFDNGLDLAVHMAEKWHLIPNENSTFSCEFCAEQFETRGLLFEHLKLYYEKSYECYICNVPQKGLQTIMKHLLDVHKEIYLCRICGQISGNEKELKRDLRRHKLRLRSIDASNFVCDFCQKPMDNEFTLHKHIVTEKHVQKNAEGKYPCEFCDASFYETVKLESHMSVHISEILFCYHCDEKVKGIVSFHRHLITKHKEQTNPLCEFCNKGTKSKQDLKNFKQLPYDDKLYQCSKCDKVYNFEDLPKPHKDCPFKLIRYHLGTDAGDSSVNFIEKSGNKTDKVIDLTEDEPNNNPTLVKPTAKRRSSDKTPDSSPPKKVGTGSLESQFQDESTEMLPIDEIDGCQIFKVQSPTKSPKNAQSGSTSLPTKAHVQKKPRKRLINTDEGHATFPSAKKHNANQSPEAIVLLDDDDDDPTKDHEITGLNSTKHVNLEKKSSPLEDHGLTAKNTKDQPLTKNTEDQHLVKNNEEQPLTKKTEDPPLVLNTEDQPLVANTEDQPPVTNTEDQTLAKNTDELLKNTEDQPCVTNTQDQPMVKNTEDQPQVQNSKVDYQVKGDLTVPTKNAEAENESEENFWMLCDECGHDVFSKAQLEDHIKIHGQEASFLCMSCGMAFEKHQAGYLHKLKEHPEESHKNWLEEIGISTSICLICKKSFKEESEMDEHIGAHADGTIDENGKERNEEEMPEQNNITEEEPMHPNGNSVGSAQIHAGPKSKELRVCLTKVSVPSVKVSKPRGPFACKKCSDSFFSKENLKSHSILHRKNRARICELCYKIFKTPLRAKIHKKSSHSNKKVKSSFKCEFCNLKYPGKTRLNKHKTFAHASSFTSLIKCAQCRKSFKTRNIYQSHLEKTHSEQKMKCHICKNIMKKYMWYFHKKRVNCFSGFL